MGAGRDGRSGFAACLPGGDEVRDVRQRIQIVGIHFMGLDLNSKAFFQERYELDGRNRVEYTARNEWR